MTIRKVDEEGDHSLSQGKNNIDREAAAG